MNLELHNVKEWNSLNLAEIQNIWTCKKTKLASIYIHFNTLLKGSVPPETALSDVNWSLTGSVGYKRPHHQLYFLSSFLLSWIVCFTRTRVDVSLPFLKKRKKKRKKKARSKQCLIAEFTIFISQSSYSKHKWKPLWGSFFKKIQDECLWCSEDSYFFIFHKCPKFILNNKAVVKKKAVSGEQHLQRFVFRKYQTKAFWCLVRY